MHTLKLAKKGEDTMGKQINCSRSRQRGSAVRLISAVLLGLSIFGLSSYAEADLMHNSVDTGSTRWNGRWGVAGGRYGEFTCATCHEPLSQNLKNIRKTITVMNPWSSHTFPGGSQSVSVTFLNNTSMGNDRSSHTSSNRICEVCHSQLTYHNADSNNNTGVPKLGHPAQGGQPGVCINCHSHNAGFKASCGGCHGNPPTTTTLGAPDGLIKLPKASKALKSGEAGVHKAHTDRGQVCDTCHYINDGSIKMPNLSNTIQLGFFGFGGKVTSGKYVPWSSAGRGYRIASSTPNTTIASVVPNYTNANKCSQVYCHGGGVKIGGTTVKAPISGFGSYTTWWWTAPAGTATCGSCHPATAANPPSLGSHQKHAGLQSAGRYEISCEKCHPSSIDNSHVQGVSRWDLKVADPLFGASATYRGAATTNTNQLAPNLPYGQCANLYCHSDGAGGPGNVTTPTWGDSSGFADCKGCHGGTLASGTPIGTGSHAGHINSLSNSSLGTPFGCVSCHAATVSNDTTVSVISRHVNIQKDYSGARAGHEYSQATGVCSNVYCHSDGKGRQNVPFTALNGWNSGTVYSDCIRCHGNDARLGHYSSIAGEPNYRSGAQGSYSANSHNKHVVNYGGSSTCFKCHTETVNPAGTAVIGGSLKHADGVIDVKSDGTFTSFNWNKSPRTCTSNVCHFNKTVTWGDKNINCNSCHGADAATLTTKKHTAHISTAANSSLGTALGCVECHAKTVVSNSAISGYATHSNRVYGDYSGVRAGRSYTTADGICSNVYCHSDGKGRQNVPFTAGNGWNSGATFTDCKQCHGNDDQFGHYSTHAGEPNYQNAGINQLRSNSHKKHTKSGAVTCSNCHSDTTTSGTAIKTGSTTHINGERTVLQNGTTAIFVWDNGANKTCSNINCHFNNSATWGDTLTCDSCHGNDEVTLTTKKHSAHISTVANPTLGVAFGCIDCHAKTVSSNDTIANEALHANTFKDYSGRLAGGSSSYNSGTGTCANVYCHSDGKGRINAPFTAGTGWNSAVVYADCKQCHGNDTQAGYFTSSVGEPNYQNGGPGTARANTHTGSHVGAGLSSCANCHVNTVTAGGAVNASGTHVNGTPDVVIGNGRTGSYNPVDKSCSNVSCHGSGTSIQWGSTAGCATCHGDLISKPGVHSTHISDMITSGLVTMYNYTAINSDNGKYRIGCANCHPTDTGHHQDGHIDVTVNKDKAGRSSLAGLNNATADFINAPGSGITGTTKVSVTCSMVYCHSSGRSTVQANNDFRTTPDWYSTAGSVANRCGMCHDNPPQYEGQSHFVAASNLGNNGAPPYQESGHMVGIHFNSTYVGNNGNGFLGYSSLGNAAHGNTQVATTISCITCHNGIVDPDVAKVDTFAMYSTGTAFDCSKCHKANTRTKLQSGNIVGTGLHINGRKDVVFTTGTFKTKAQLSNVANAGGYWTRIGEYKAVDSYDSTNLGSSSWDAGTKTCLTECHVRQPGITWGNTGLQCMSCHADQ